MHSAAETNLIKSSAIATEQEAIVESITEESMLLMDLRGVGYGQDTAYIVRIIAGNQLVVLHLFLIQKERKCLIWDRALGLPLQAHTV